MKNDHVQNSQTAHRFLLMVCLAAVAATFAVARPQAAYADDEIVVPDVPVKLEVPAGHKVFLEGHAIGTQDYVCVRFRPRAQPSPGHSSDRRRPCSTTTSGKSSPTF